MYGLNAGVDDVEAGVADAEAALLGIFAVVVVVVDVEFEGFALFGFLAVSLDRS